MSDISSIKRNSAISIQLHNHSNVNNSPIINIQNQQGHHSSLNPNFIIPPQQQNFKSGHSNSFLNPLSAKNLNQKYDGGGRNNNRSNNGDEDFQLSINIDESIKINDDLSDKLSLKLIHNQIDNDNHDFSQISGDPQNLNFDKSKINQNSLMQDYKNNRKHNRDFFNSRTQYNTQNQQQSQFSQQAPNQVAQQERFQNIYNNNNTNQTISNPLIQLFPTSTENSIRKQPLAKQILQQPLQQQLYSQRQPQQQRALTPNLAIALNSSKRMNNPQQHRRELSIHTPSSGFNQSDTGARMLASEQNYNRSSQKNQVVNFTQLQQDVRDRGASMISPNEKNSLPIQSIVRTSDHNIANNPVQLISATNMQLQNHRSSIFHTKNQFQKEELTSDNPSDQSHNQQEENGMAGSAQLINNYNIHGLNNAVHSNSNYSITKGGSPNPNKRTSFLNKFSSQKVFQSRRESGIGQQKIIQFQNPLSIVNLEDEDQENEEEFNKQKSPKRNTMNTSYTGLAVSVKSPNESLNKINIRKGVYQRQSSVPDQENSMINTQQLININVNQQNGAQLNSNAQNKTDGLPLQEIALQHSSQQQQNTIMTFQQQQQEYVSPKSMFSKQVTGAKSPDKFQGGVGGFISQREGSGQNSNDGSFLKHLDPKQRETIFFIFRDRQQHQRYSERFSSFKNGNSWYEKLGLKAEKVKERLRQQNKLINHMIQRRNKFISDQIRILESIKKQKKLIQNQQSSEQDVKFEEEIQYDVELLKNQIEDLEDLYKEAQDLLTIFSVAIHKSSDTNELPLNPNISKIFHIYQLQSLIS